MMLGITQEAGMRTHDNEHLDPRNEHILRRPPADPGQLAGLTSASLGVLRGTIDHLQRTAGNARVGSLLDSEQERSSVLDVVGSGGSALDAATRSEMESSFGQDFGDVRIHTGSAAADSAHAVQAQAYTVGSDVVLGMGHDPNSAAGRHTLAHELTHVIQQRSGPVDGTPTGGGISVSDPSDRFEQEAEARATEFDAGVSTHGPSVDDRSAATALSPSVQRQGEDEEHPEELDG
jgi:hypothetical protein